MIILNKKKLFIAGHWITLRKWTWEKEYEKGNFYKLWKTKGTLFKSQVEKKFCRPIFKWHLI